MEAWADSKPLRIPRPKFVVQEVKMPLPDYDDPPSKDIKSLHHHHHHHHHHHLHHHPQHLMHARLLAAGGGGGGAGGDHVLFGHQPKVEKA